MKLTDKVKQLYNNPEKQWIVLSGATVLYYVIMGIFFYFAHPIIGFMSFTSTLYLLILILPLLYLIGFGLGFFLTKKSINLPWFQVYTVKQGTNNVIKCRKTSSALNPKSTPKYLLIGTGIIFIISSIIISLSDSKIFNASRYYEQLAVTSGTEANFKDVFDYKNGKVLLPVLDKDLAFKKAQTSLQTYGDQYEIREDHFSIQSVHRDGADHLIRVTPLEYNNFFLSLTDLNSGTPGYVEVDVITKVATLRKVPDGIHYVESGMFNSNLSRYFRFQKLTSLYDDYYFEIDDENNPYWVFPTIKHEISLWGGEESNGVTILNAVTGETNSYKIGSEPDWVDHVASPQTMLKQAANYLKYKEGWFNAALGSKKEVYQLSDGYNYFIQNGHSYLVSAVTSRIENDQTSIGFMALDLKENNATFFKMESITEMRAAEIAAKDNRVKAQNFTPTWPILIDYNEVPTYFLVLKNSVTVQKYVFLDVKTGLNIAIGDTIDSAKLEYESLIGGGFQDSFKTSGTVTDIRDTGNKIEFRLDNDPAFYYSVDPALSLDARFLKVGDKVSLTYSISSNAKVVSLLVKL